MVSKAMGGVLLWQDITFIYSRRRNAERISSKGRGTQQNPPIDFHSLCMV